VSLVVVVLRLRSDLLTPSVPFTSGLSRSRIDHKFTVHPTPPWAGPILL